MQKRVFASAVAILMLLVAGCRSHDLTRDEAAKLISNSDEVKVVVKKEIMLGPDLQQGMGGFLNSLTGMFDHALADCLVGMEYIKDGPAGYVLTSKGQTAEQEWGKDPERPNGRFVSVAHTEFVEVSRISQAEGAAEADAEFKWKWQWYPIMNGMDNSEIGADCQVTMADKFGYDYGNQTFATNTGRAKLRRYDDGWRLESVALQ